jgi:nitroreductase
MKYNLSEITQVIKNRRTIYPEMYSSRKVHREIIEDILNNAIWAPTHGNTQPWRFKVFMDIGLNRLSEFQSSLYQELNKGEDFKELKFKKLKERPLKASAVIAVCMKRDKNLKIEAVACAIQNMHLTCTAYGIGGFWSTSKLIYSQKTNAFLQIGEKDKCLGFFYIGYPEVSWPKGQRKPIEYVTEWIES